MDENQKEQLRLEREERIRQNNSPKKGKDAFSVVTTVQFVLFLSLAVIIIAVSKFGGETAENLKNDFSALMNWKIVENAGEAVASVKEFLNEPFSLMPALSPIQTVEEETSSEALNETQASDESEAEKTTEQAEETTFNEEETSSAEENETVSATESMGGEDIEVYKAADNTSFSPVVTTCAIIKPVESTSYTSYFGYRINPITGKWAFHTGLDMAAPSGTKIKAAYSGTVRKVGEDSRSGKYIFLTHDDGFETFYCHCSEIIAEEGAVIRQGETIAKVGSTGWATGPHLHFEIRKNNERLNPLSVLGSDDD